VSTNERGVSPVIGVVLLVAITTLLAALVGTMALGFGGELGAPTEYASVSTTYAPSGAANGGVAYVNITHESGDVLDGDEVYIRDSNGNEVLWKDVWTGGDTIEPGEYVHIDGKDSDCALNAVTEGEIYRVVYAPNGTDSSTVLAELEIESPPDSTGTYGCP
jgi:flagellin-like protein